MGVSFKISASAGDYHVGFGRLESIISSESIILCDSRFAEEFSKSNEKIIPIDASEHAKSLENLAAVVQRLRECGADRGTLLTAVGGGVIQDVATFVTSIYMRGISWEYVPTTLLAMVDSCIGGKSAINVGTVKNLVGNFWPPSRILIDTHYIKTLDIRQRVDGLCEAAKICFVRGPEVFRQFAELNPSPSTDMESLTEIILLSLRAKQWFIEIDEHDRSERLLLNFGHTFGHAIEGACNYQISHGVAVGIGILSAIEFTSNAQVSVETTSSIKQLKSCLQNLLRQVPNLTDAIESIDHESFIRGFLADKKHRSDSFSLICPSKTGSVERVLLARNENVIRKVQDSVSQACDQLK